MRSHPLQTMNENWDPDRLARRYQNQSWYVKLWRRRKQIPTWWRAFKYWRRYRFGPRYQEDLRNGEYIDTFKNFLSIERGMACNAMDWWHTEDEVREIEKRYLQKK